MALSGWDSSKQLKLTIDSSNVDEDLTNFPVLVTLNSGTGQTGFDTTRVFDELIPTTVESGTLLHMNGDQSSSAHTVTSNGTPTLHPSTTFSGFNSLGYMGFDGSVDYLTIADHEDWDFGAGDLTIDFWFRSDGAFSGVVYFINKYSSPNERSWNIMYDNSVTTMYFSYSKAGTPTTYYAATYSGTLNIDTWYHLAGVRNGSNLHMFIDGVELADSPVNIGSEAFNDPSRQVQIMAYLSTVSKGYMSEIRVSKGTARWITDFIPPTSPYEPDSYTKLLLHFDGDQSDNQHVVTFNGTPQIYSSAGKFGGSYYFDGSTEYLTSVNHADWDFGSGDFTIEFWMYSTASRDDCSIVQHSENAGSNWGWMCFYNTDDFAFYYSYNGTSWNSIWTTGDAVPLNEWVHWAFVKNGTDMNIYKNGVSIASGSVTSAIYDTGEPLLIGRRDASGNYFQGYLSELNILKGTAKYISNFTTPEGPPGSSWDHRRKIAITDSNDNQLYTEIERWDYENEEANLWVKVPTIASGTDTDLSLYYDSAHDDNIHYVGGLGDLSYEMVVGLSEEGVYDTIGTGHPCVIKESDSSYKMWYSGQSTGWRILYATSTNGTTWSGHQMIIDLGDEGTYDTTHVYTPCVIKESDSSYKMWYSGHDGLYVRILYAVSENGTTWSGHSLVVNTNNISYDSTHVYYPHVIKESDTSYKMWYSGNDATNWRVLYAISDNGTTWSGHQMVIDIGEVVPYDTTHALGPYVIKESSSFYKMWYSVYDGSNWRLIYADSTNGTTWSNHQLNINNNAEGTYDTSSAYYCCAIKESDTSYKIWYTGNDGSNSRIIYSPYWSTNVWDKDFVGVWHMNQDPSWGTDAVKDSTAHVSHGTSAGSMTSGDLVDGKIGKGIDFDGSDDYINCGNDSNLDFGTGSATVEAIVKEAGSDGNYRAIISKRTNSNYTGYSLYKVPTSDNIRSEWASAHGGPFYNPGTATADPDIYYYITVVLDRGSDLLKMFKDGQPAGVDDDVSALGDVDNVTDLRIGDQIGNDTWYGVIDEVRVSNANRSDAWIKATYYSNWNNFITFDEYVSVIFTFSNPIPVDLSTVYGTTQQLYLTTTVTGAAPSYVYDATFYDASDSSMINSTVSGVQSGQPAGVIMSTVSGIDYQWYITATSSGLQDTSSTYTFTNRFLCEGQVQVADIPASGIPVRLYLRDTGEYIGGTTSAGVSGTFEIETTHNDYHYAVALYDSSNTNALISDWLIPSN